MKISFNDKSLHTTFEYPSESSLVREAEGETEQEAEAEEGADVDGALEQPSAFFLPRAKFVGGVAPESPRLPSGSSGECPPAPVDSTAGSMGHVCALTCSHVCPSACRPVQLHSKALHGLQQLAGAGAGTGPG